MVGISGRSGGANRRTSEVSLGDGSPESPRELSSQAKVYFEWLIERLGAGEEGSGWSRADGSLLASVAELLESEAILGELIKQSPEDLRLHRMRGQFADRIVRVSNLIGLCPRDRAKLPEVPTEEAESAFKQLLERMTNG